MNLSTAIFLINPRARAILVTYQDGDDTVMFKTLDQSIKKDDLVMVKTNTRHGMTAVKVEAVDVPVDFDSVKQVEWIVGRVNVEDYEELKAMEDDAIEKIRAAEKLRKQRQLQADLEELLAVGGETTKQLAIASIGDTKEVIAAPSASTAEG